MAEAANLTASSCPYCTSSVTGGGETRPCADCGAVHHEECWTENGGCAVVSCAAGPDAPTLTPSTDTAFAPPAGAAVIAGPTPEPLNRPTLPPVKTPSLQSDPAANRSLTTGPVSFTKAVSDGFSRYATFSGRASRSAYWWWQVFEALVVVGWAVSAAASEAFGIIVLVGGFLVLIVPHISLTARRLHDMNVSAWWLLGVALLSLIPFGIIGVVIWMCMPGTAGDNRYGPGY